MKYVIATYKTKDAEPKTYLKYWYLLEGEGINWYRIDKNKEGVEVREYPNHETARAEIFKTLKYRIKEE
jgi:hypothetical protein